MMICSACLAGMACKYSGKNNNTDLRVVELVQQGKCVPVCPEMLGGLPVPRLSCERKDGKVINTSGEDKTFEFVEGAKTALSIAKGINAKVALLQPRSPSCGLGQIYDGNFHKTLISGNGIFVEMCLENNIEVYTPDLYFKNKD